MSLKFSDRMGVTKVSDVLQLDSMKEKWEEKEWEKWGRFYLMLSCCHCSTNR